MQAIAEITVAVTNELPMVPLDLLEKVLAKLDESSFQATCFFQSEENLILEPPFGHSGYKKNITS
ncbi:hypothetical protein ACJX0J_023726, partial [Zea mays]